MQMYEDLSLFHVRKAWEKVLRDQPSLDFAIEFMFTKLFELKL